MKTVGIAELKENTNEIINQVQGGEVINISSGGATIARLIPVQQSPLTEKEIEAILDDLDSLAVEISAQWPMGVSAQDAIDDARS